VYTIDSGHYGDGVARRTKRLWTDEEKRSICFQTTALGVSVAQVARRYAVNANLIFKWLRDPRYAPDPAAALPASEEARFLPIEIVAETRSAPAAPAAENHPALGASSNEGGGDSGTRSNCEGWLGKVWKGQCALPLQCRASDGDAVGGGLAPGETARKSRKRRRRWRICISAPLGALISAYL